MNLCEMAVWWVAVWAALTGCVSVLVLQTETLYVDRFIVGFHYTVSYVLIANGIDLVQVLQEGGLLMWDVCHL